jgi:hypothetical protein
MSEAAAENRANCWPTRIAAGDPERTRSATQIYANRVYVSGGELEMAAIAEQFSEERRLARP